MVAQDIIDCLNTKYRNRNWGVDTIRWISYSAFKHYGFKNDFDLLNVFRNLGSCESKTVKKVSDMDQLLNCYMLRYKKYSWRERARNRWFDQLFIQGENDRSF
jgi:hypothetical protein